MGVTFEPERSEKKATHKLERRTYVDARFNVVAENDPAAAFLLGAEGAEIEIEVAEKAGLLTKNASSDLEDKTAKRKKP